MNFQEVIHSDIALNSLISDSLSGYKNELRNIVIKAKSVLFNNQFDESDVDFHELIDNAVKLAPMVDIDDELSKLDSMSSLYADEMHEHQGFSFNSSPTEILDESELDPTLLCCYLIYWSCEMLYENSSSIEQYQRIALIACQLNWLSAAKQVLYYSENRFDEEDKNRKKVRPQYEFGAQIIKQLQSKGYQFEELKLASEAIVVLLRDLFQKFEAKESISPPELSAFDIHKIINPTPINQLTQQFILESFEDKWNKQFGEDMWRIEKNKAKRWVLITANHLKHFINTSSPGKSMSSALREKLSLNLKSGKRPVSVINTTIEFLCKELDLEYQEEDKYFFKR